MKLYFCLFSFIASTNACFIEGHPESCVGGGDAPVYTIRVIQEEAGHGGHVGHIGGHVAAPVQTIRVIQQEVPPTHSHGVQTIRVVQAEGPHASHNHHRDVKTIRVIQEEGHGNFAHHQEYRTPEHFKTIKIVHKHEGHEHHPEHAQHVIKVIKIDAPVHEVAHEQVINVFKEEGHSHGGYEHDATGDVEQIIKIIAAAGADDGHHYYH